MYPGHSNPSSSSPTLISFPCPQLSASYPPFPFSFLLNVLSPVNAACMRINVGHPLEHGQLPRDSSPKESWLSLPSSSQLPRAAQLGWAMSFLSRLCWEVAQLQFYLSQAVSVVMSSWGHEYKGPVDWALNPIKNVWLPIQCPCHSATYGCILPGWIQVEAFTAGWDCWRISRLADYIVPFSTVKSI